MDAQVISMNASSARSVTRSGGYAYPNPRAETVSSVPRHRGRPAAAVALRIRVGGAEAGRSQRVDETGTGDSSS